ncbi:amidohydrolase family protein [Parahaliea aestuarii]|uniref:Beta-aspartyl-peptidase n=1 Tax=Parahaliea aestuarii TaxID=1852021 RepID=A0A5C8ZQK7_9GAMM|nr:amidohydrolase family protein [Parahaliea aestuarii]TXS90019.1 beta-aspartyl-peptidase [Parahaliea aestuarii]
MLTLIRNAEVHSPRALGVQDVLVADGRIAAVGQDLSLSGTGVEEIDARGLWLLPGFVDLLTHPCGGGGEGGFGNRTAELSAEDLLRAGVTTAVGALGTDSLCRSPEVLYGAIMALRARGLGAYMYSGAYRVPPVTLTGDVARDLVLVEPVLGVGEVAIADHRGSHPSAAELVRLAADVQLGATLAGKRGTVLVHVGGGEQRLALLREALASADLPRDSFLPTHANRSRALFEEAQALALDGAWIDFTVSTTPEFIAEGEVPALDALLEAVACGVPPDRLTVSSDAGGSLPLYVDGELRGLQQAGPGVLLQLLAEAAARGEHFEAVLGALTANPSAALGLAGKGRIAPGADADLLLYDPAAGQLEAVSCRGRWLLRDGHCHCPRISTF